MPSLHQAISRCNTLQVHFLTKKGCDVNRPDSRMRTPLQLVCDLDNEPLGVSLGCLLLASGAGVHQKDKYGISVFSYACIKQRPKLVKCMICEREISWLDKDHQGNTALHHAAKTGNTLITKTIIHQMGKYGWNIDPRNNRYETPLILAEKMGHLQCAELLRYSGKASTGARDNLAFKNADEWRHTGLEREPTKFSSYFSTKFPEVVEQLKTVVDGEKCPVRLHPRTELMAQTLHPGKSVKRDILPRLINLLPEQQMDTFRAAAKAPKYTEQHEDEERQCAENETRATCDQMQVKKKALSFSDLTTLTQQRFNTKKPTNDVAKNSMITMDNNETNHVQVKKLFKRRHISDLINVLERVSSTARERKTGEITTIYEETDR
ncbi:uncharacterized protein [Montipora foliosa]|uniref:uncharacterized protein n=1 Tax=Montipora foliosa TaxID=591990 RepID=UPI0035F11177